MVSPWWRMAFLAEVALPSGVIGPRDLAPLARDAARRASEMLVTGIGSPWVFSRLQDTFVSSDIRVSKKGGSGEVVDGVKDKNIFRF